MEIKEYNGFDVDALSLGVTTTYNKETEVFHVVDTRDGKQLALMTKDQARQFADAVGDILTDEGFLITKNMKEVPCASTKR